MIQSYHTALLAEVHRLIDLEIEEEAKIVVIGNGINDYAAYRERVGRVYAYRRIVDLLFEDARSNIEKG